ncbi:MAG: hypothetical protein SPJ06_05010 [Bacilli bacterium]|nr:hypothetical protein [Bacilli bacterium]
MEKNMKINFEYLKRRVEDALEKTDLEFIRSELLKIKDASIVSGVGGSSVVSEFGSKVLNQKNGIISINCEPRDFLYQGVSGFKNVISCSYSGNNYGVDLSFDNDLKKYLLSNNPSSSEDVVNLQYQTTIDKERSFISLGATLIPVSILMDYYLEGEDNKLLDLILEKDFSFEPSHVYEIFSGYDTRTAAKYLESTLVESGIGIPIVHDKYSYCHGRSTLSTVQQSNAIYFNRGTEFDKMMVEELKQYYQEVIVINSKSRDQVIDDFQMLVQTMYLTKYLAEKQSKDLSKVEYSPVNKKLYKYSGQI